MSNNLEFYLPSFPIGAYIRYGEDLLKGLGFSLLPILRMIKLRGHVQMSEIHSKLIRSFV